MAVTTTVTYKPKRAASLVALPHTSVVTKTISFDVPAGTATNGYNIGDTIRVPGLFPAGTELTGFWWKTSVSQGSATFAAGIYTGGSATAIGTLNTAAFVAAVAPTDTTMVKPTLVPGTKSVNTISTAEGDLGLVIAAAVTVAATITVTLQLTSIDSAVSTYPAVGN